AERRGVAERGLPGRSVADPRPRSRRRPPHAVARRQRRPRVLPSPVHPGVAGALGRRCERVQLTVSFVREAAPARTAAICRRRRPTSRSCMPENTARTWVVRGWTAARARLRQRWPWIFAAVGVTIFAWPLYRQAENDGIDPSWQFSMHRAFH